MNKKEINELKARVYSISNCMFPLDAFLNDIEQVKNQNYNKESAYNDLKLITDAVYELKDKLKEKEQNYTLEECKKMWEYLGYECWEPNEKTFCATNEDDEEIQFSLKPKLYYTVSDWSIIIDTKLHDIITKTIKALEKEKK